VAQQPHDQPMEGMAEFVEHGAAGLSGDSGYLFIGRSGLYLRPRAGRQVRPAFSVQAKRLPDRRIPGQAQDLTDRGGMGMLSTLSP
jgi:hypothetical protein